MDKNENKNINIESDGTKRIIDLRRFLEHDIYSPADSAEQRPSAAYERREGTGELTSDDLGSPLN